MIYMDTPRAVSFRQFKRTAHLMSDAVGDAGSSELMQFARGLGLRAEWLQHAGTPKEHFDLFDSRIEAAKRAGAVEVPPRELFRRCVIPKRAP